MNDTHLLTVEIVAKLDAIFLPARRYTLSADSDQLHAMADYRREGLQIHPIDSSPAGRQRFSRNCRAAEEAGLIEVLRHNYRANGVRVTVAGYFTGCALAGTGTFNDTLRIMRRLAKSADYTTELDLAGLKAYGRGWENKVFTNEAALRPAHIFGWVADCVGCRPVIGGTHNWRLTPAGRLIVEAPPATGPLPKHDPEASALYAEIFEGWQFPRGMTPEEVARFRHPISSNDAGKSETNQAGTRHIEGVTSNECSHIRRKTSPVGDRDPPRTKCGTAPRETQHPPGNQRRPGRQTDRSLLRRLREGTCCAGRPLFRPPQWQTSAPRLHHGDGPRTADVGRRRDPPGPELHHQPLTTKGNHHGKSN